MSKYIEKIVDAINTALTDETTGVNAKIAAINIEYDDFDVDSIIKIYKGRMFSIEEYPCLVIWPEDSPAEEQANHIDQNHIVTVYAAITNEDDQENMHKKLWRTLRAVTESVRATVNLSTGGTPVVTLCSYAGHTYGSPWFIEQGNFYIESGGVKFEIIDEETL